MNISIISLVLAVLIGKTTQEKPLPPPPPPPAVVEEQKYKVIKTYIGEVTGYSSREEETDDTPFITASGATVHWGTVATNGYQFGTKIRFPELYKDKIFVVRDRMNARYENRLDIWFPEHKRAVRFGIINTRVEIVQDSSANFISMR